VIDDNQSFVKSIAAISKVPVKWIFEGYDSKQLCEKLAIEIIAGYNELNNYLVLINVNIKLDKPYRYGNNGINLYRLAIGKFKSGSQESILLYSFLSKVDLGKRNVFIKILPNYKFKRLPLDFQTFVNFQ